MDGPLSCSLFCPGGPQPQLHLSSRLAVHSFLPRDPTILSPTSSLSYIVNICRLVDSSNVCTYVCVCLLHAYCSEISERTHGNQVPKDHQCSKQESLDRAYQLHITFVLITGVVQENHWKTLPWDCTLWIGIPNLLETFLSRSHVRLEVVPPPPVDLFTSDPLLAHLSMPISLPDCLLIFTDYVSRVKPLKKIIILIGIS